MNKCFKMLAVVLALILVCCTQMFTLMISACLKLIF
jgi:hypothetical protein